MKMQSKYSLNMNEVVSCHRTSENKQHLRITFVFKRNAQSECNITYIIHIIPEIHPSRTNVFKYFPL